MATVSSHGASPAIYKKLPYDPVKDFAPITNVMSVPSVLVVHPKLPVKNLKEFIQLAKASPGKYSYGSPGTGTLGHANVENFTQLAGIQLLHVPYKGAGPAMNDALAGQVDALTDNLPSALTHIQAGRFRALAVLSPQRSKLLPQVPTYMEQGFQDMSEGGWFGLMAPAGTPPAVVKKSWLRRTRPCKIRSSKSAPTPWVACLWPTRPKNLPCRSKPHWPGTRRL